MLYEAMSLLDPVTHAPRGYLRMAPQPLMDSVLLTLDVRSRAWHDADTYVRTGATQAAQVRGWGGGGGRGGGCWGGGGGEARRRVIQP